MLPCTRFWWRRRSCRLCFFFISPNRNRPSRCFRAQGFWWHRRSCRLCFFFISPNRNSRLVASVHKVFGGAGGLAACASSSFPRTETAVSLLPCKRFLVAQAVLPPVLLLHSPEPKPSRLRLCGFVLLGLDFFAARKDLMRHDCPVAQAVLPPVFFIARDWKCVWLRLRCLAGQDGILRLLGKPALERLLEQPAGGKTAHPTQKKT